MPLFSSTGLKFTDFSPEYKVDFWKVDRNFFKNQKICMKCYTFYSQFFARIPKTDFKKCNLSAFSTVGRKWKWCFHFPSTYQKRSELLQTNANCEQHVKKSNLDKKLFLLFNHLKVKYNVFKSGFALPRVFAIVQLSPYLMTIFSEFL